MCFTFVTENIAQGKFEKATPLYERSLKLRESALGQDHPTVAEELNDLAVLLEAQVRH